MYWVKVIPFINLYRKRKDKKMEASKERSGSTPLGILVTGKTIARKVLGFSSISRETSTRVCGLLIKGMAKGHIGETKMGN